MLKRVPVARLRPGMFVHHLNCDWLDHTFARNRFLIRDETTVRRIRALGVGEVWVDMRRSTVRPDDDTTEATAPRDPAAPSAPAPAAAEKRYSLEEERKYALRLIEQATHCLETAMRRSQRGQQVAAREFVPIVDGMLDSLERHPGVLIGLCRLRNRDRYTFEHSVSVGVLAAAIGRSLGMARKARHALAMGGLLHDLGKSRTPLRILNKPGMLSATEFAIIKRHVDHGAHIASQIEGLPTGAMNAITQHHERLDGTGYPRGLKGEQISREGRIVAVCDVFDAMSSDRCYHSGQEPTKVMQLLLHGCGIRFDTAAVHHLIRNIGIYPAGTLVSMASGRLGMVVRPGEKGLLYPVVRVFYDMQRRLHLAHHDVDLSQVDDERIVAPEPPERWNLDPELLPQLE